jgi:hypothetical protein
VVLRITGRARLHHRRQAPGSLWVTGLSVRLFGMNSLSVLGPQTLMGVAAVTVVFAAVRRAVPDPAQDAVAGLIAGAVLACTPAAALMFGFNNPDARLVLLLTVAAYCLARAIHAASWRWLVLVGVVTGTAFLTKMLQGSWYCRDSLPRIYLRHRRGCGIDCCTWPQALARSSPRPAGGYWRCS